jgi:hypothetical protein
VACTEAGARLKSAARVATRVQGEETPFELESSGDDKEEEHKDEEEGEVISSPRAPSPEIISLPCDLFGWQVGILLAVIKCIYLPSAYLYFMQDIEDWCLLLMSSTSFVDLPFQEHRMMEKHHMDQNPCTSSICSK